MSTTSPELLDPSGSPHFVGYLGEILVLIEKQERVAKINPARAFRRVARSADKSVKAGVKKVNVPGGVNSTLLIQQLSIESGRQ